MRSPLHAAVSFAFILALAGCWAPGQGTPASGIREENVRIEMPTGANEVKLVRVDRVTTGSVIAGMDETWKGLQAVYFDLGIDPEKLSVLDPAHHRIGFAQVRVRRIAGGRPSTYLNCGQTMGMQQADQGHTMVTLTSWLEPGEGGTMVHTRLQATAGSNTSTAAAPCETTGRLEQLIMKKLIMQLFGGAS